MKAKDIVKCLIDISNYQWVRVTFKISNCLYLSRIMAFRLPCSAGFASLISVCGNLQYNSNNSS